MLQYDGCLDMIYTIREARRLGLASLLSIRLMAQMFERQEHVFTHVDTDNRKSLGLVTKMGFQETGTNGWIEFEPSISFN
jgi:ribosomal protein S18 acetylase RimI-like enzyme